MVLEEVYYRGNVPLYQTILGAYNINVAHYQ